MAPVYVYVRWLTLFFADCSVECARKPKAEDFPRNFSLIKLLEKTLERQRKK